MMTPERKAAEHKAAGVARRTFLRAIGVGTAAAASAPLAVPAAADTESKDERRRARYQPDSPEVQTYYRVNRYPPMK